MISIGAASAPARSSSARSLAACGLSIPVIWKREPSSDWIVATVSTSPRPRSNSTTAIGFFRFSRETSRIVRPAASLSWMPTAARWFSSKVAWAPVSCSPEKMTCLRSTTGAPRPTLKSSLPKGTGPLPITAACASALGSTSRASSVAVRPRMSLAFAVSWTPGSCTTMRSAPCCWITGSATPSSLTRLCSVVMFCFSAVSRTSFSVCGRKLTTSRRSPSSGAPITRPVRLFVSSVRARERVSSSRKRISTF